MKSQKHPYLFLILTALFCIIMIGNNCASAQTEDAAYKNLKEIIYDNSKHVPEYSRELVTDALVDYMMIKTSLANGKAADARFTTLTLLKVIADYSRSMDPKFLPDAEKFNNDLAALKEKVTRSTTLEEARENFSVLTNSFMDYVKSYGLDNKTLYVFQCNDNAAYGKGYWLSNSMFDTMNPYTDQKSGDCYSLKESWSFSKSMSF